MFHQELVTAIQENIKINVIVIDNGGWQCIHNLQKSQGIPSFGCELRFRDESTGRLDGEYIPIDFAMNTRSYGCDSWTVKTEEELVAAMKAAAANPKTTVIGVKSTQKSMTGNYEGWWRVGTLEISETEAVMTAAKVVREYLDEAKEY